MKVYRSLEAIPARPRKAFVTIGNFDGVHLGHQILFSEVVARACANQGTSIAITFDPHPLQVVRPEAGIKLISNMEQKIELIQLANIDLLVILPFNQELAETPARDFIDTIMDRIGITELVVGYDYAFGRGRQGDIPFLKTQGAARGFKVSVVEAYHVEDMLASSTRVRELVAEGRMRDVKKLLGRFYQIRGEVKIGKQRGGPLVGFPTANLEIAPEDLCPRLGVYVTQVIYDGRCYGGVLNIGKNPTFGDAPEGVSAETHIFDFNQDIYGKPIKVNLIQFIRGEKKFPNPAALTEQIARDISQARAVITKIQQEVLLSCEDRFNH